MDCMTKLSKCIWECGIMQQNTFDVFLNKRQENKDVKNKPYLQDVLFLICCITYNKQ